jgi:flagellar motor switch protein FliM
VSSVRENLARSLEPAVEAIAWRPTRLRPSARLDHLQCELLRALPRLCEAPAATLEQTGQALEAFTGQPARVRAGEPAVLPGADALLRGAAVLAAFELGPVGVPVWLEVEPGLVHGLVDLSLGGTGLQLGPAPPTSIELGIFAVLVASTLHRLASGMPAIPRPRLLSLAWGDSPPAAVPEGPLAVIQLEFDAGPVGGVVRLLAPAAALLPLETGRRGRAPAMGAWPRVLPPVALRVEMGRTAVEVGDLSRLRPGDVVLLDEARVRTDRGESGRVWLRAGLGVAVALEAQLETAGDRYRVRLERGVMPEGARTMEQVESLDGMAVLRDVPLEVVAELARLQVSVEDILALRPGQVLELEVGPGGPIQLSIHGRVVARGELVEVDGHLGVKLTALGAP